MNWALLCAILFIFFVLFALWHNSLFSKAKVELKANFAQKVVYRIVNGNEKTIKHEQKIYNKRARSLWGKEMRSWATFRIYFPLNPNYGVFGIFVPNDFKIDEDCLKELALSLAS